MTGIRLSLAWLGTRALLVWMLAGAWWYRPTVDVRSDLMLYAQWATRMLREGQLPYRDFVWEYPAGALPAFLLPGIPDASTLGYITRFILLMLVVDAFATVTLFRLGRSRGHQRGAIVWCVAIPLLGPITLTRFDIVIGLFVVAAGAAMLQRRPTSFGAWIGVATTAKLWPVLLLPLGMRDRRTIGKATAAFFIPVAVLIGATVAVAGFSGFAATLTYHGKRGLQMESLPALPLVLARALGDDDYTRIFRFGASEIVGPGTARVAQLSVLLLCLTVTVLVLLGLRQGRNAFQNPATIARLGVAAVLALLVTSKVLSPQFMMWLVAVVCLLVVVEGRWRPGITIPVLVACGLTHVNMYIYVDLLTGQLAPVIVLAMRDACLLLVLTASFSSLRPRRESAAVPAEGRPGIQIPATVGANA